ncbi:MAG: DUF3035 domain-containing protein [Alphaproteobacteria bacterium]|nr:DUF3035 domain-containing protein [Alphaproteobacteria bacterium]
MNKLIVCGLVMLALNACGTLTKEKLGFGKTAPDEFMVSTRKPLSLPPEYDLRPVSNPENLEDNETSSLEDVFVKKLEAKD